MTAPTPRPEAVAELLPCSVCGIVNRNHWIHLAPFNESCHDFVEPEHHRLNTRPATDAAVLQEALEEIVRDFENDFMVGDVIVDDPDPLLKLNWQRAKAALAQADGDK